MKHLISVVLSILLLMGVMPVAYAQEYIPEVSTLPELQDAILQAESGDAIKVMQTIIVDSPMTIGETDKAITLKSGNGTSTLFRFEGDWGTESASVNDLTIDFDVSMMESAVVVNTPSTIYFSNVNWKGCGGSTGGGLYIQSGTAYVTGNFENCTAAVGSAVYVDTNGFCYLNDCTFTGNRATYNGGAVYSLGYVMASGCTFINNNAGNENGGAMAGLNIYANSSTFTGNHAQKGGAIYALNDIGVSECLIYGNTAALSGADLVSEGTAVIVVSDYATTYADQLAAGGYDAYGWYSDAEENRYSNERRTDLVNTGSQLQSPSLIFAMYESTEPEPTPTPTPSHSGGSSTHTVTPVKVEPEKIKLSCGIAEIDTDAVPDLITGLKRYTPATEVLTRGRMAALLYGLLTAESQTKCDAATKDFYTDIANSPYKKVGNALTAAGVFSVQSDGLFRPSDALSFGELLSALTSFVEPKTAYVGSFAGHWAESAAVTACVYGWIEDVPINLDAPATYGAFVNLMAKIYKL